MNSEQITTINNLYASSNLSVLINALDSRPGIVFGWGSEDQFLLYKAKYFSPNKILDKTMESIRAIHPDATIEPEGPATTYESLWPRIQIGAYHSDTWKLIVNSNGVRSLSGSQKNGHTIPNATLSLVPYETWLGLLALTQPSGAALVYEF